MKRILLIAIFVAAAVLLPVTAMGSSRGLDLPPYEKVHLKNGMTLLLMEQHKVPLIDFQMILKAGSAADAEGKEGSASLTAALLRKGTKARTADQFSSELDFIGGQFSAGAGFDTTSVSAEFVKKDLPKGLDLFTDALLNPTFPQDEFAKLIKKIGRAHV